MSEIQLTSLMFNRHPKFGPIDDVTALAPPIGTLVPGTLEARKYLGFVATVAWSFAYPQDDGKSPFFTVSGRHEVTFTVRTPVNSATADYYAKLNSVILAFPYIRNLIDSLAAKSLGSRTLVRPLDVRRFVIDKLSEDTSEPLFESADEQEPGDTDGAQSS